MTETLVLPRHKLTVADYYRMGETGVLAAKEQVADRPGEQELRTDAEQAAQVGDPARPAEVSGLIDPVHWRQSAEISLDVQWIRRLNQYPDRASTSDVIVGVRC